MQSEKSPKKDSTYEIEYGTNDNGGRAKLEIKPIPFDVYKSVQSMFTSNVDKALSILISNCAVSGKEEALSLIESGSLPAILSLENGFAQIMQPIRAEVKKK